MTDEIRDRFFKACREGDFKTVEKLLLPGSHLFIADYNPYIHVAALGGFVDIVKILYKHIREYTLPNPILAAILKNDDVLIEKLITGGVPIPEFMECLRLKKDEEFLIISTKLAQMKTTLGTVFALFYAIREKRNDRAKHLIRLGADIDARGAWCTTPLEEALNSKNIEMFVYLVEIGANIQCQNLLIKVLQDRRFDLAKILIEKGIEVSEKYGYRGHHIYPILYAATYGYLNIVKLLVQFGADINVLFYGDINLLHCAVMSQNLELIEYVLDLGFDINTPTIDGETALNLASSGGKIDSEIVELLLMR